MNDYQVDQYCLLVFSSPVQSEVYCGVAEDVVGADKTAAW